MGKRGPPPKPTALKKLQGTYQPCRAAKHELAPPPGVPVAPRWLTDAARAEWDRVVPQLADLGVLTAVDGAVLEGFVANYAAATHFQRLADSKPIVKTPFGPKVNPAAPEARKHWALAKQFGAELGLSPSARTRVSAPPKKADEGDTVEDFLFGPPKLVKPA